VYANQGCAVSASSACGGAWCVICYWYAPQSCQLVAHCVYNNVLVCHTASALLTGKDARTCGMQLPHCFADGVCSFNCTIVILSPSVTLAYWGCISLRVGVQHLVLQIC
jgi:hypothetical protein